MREQHVELDERELFNGANYESGTPETSAVFAAITKRAEKVFPDFTIERQIILGCFMSPGSLILAESQHIIDTLAEGATGNTVLDALAGSKEAAEALKDSGAPAFSPFDADPHNEFEVGDVDNAVRYAADMVAAGHSLGVDVVNGRDTADYAAAIASRCVMNGRSVLYVPCIADQKRRFRQAINANELSGQVLDVSDERCNDSIDHQLIAAVGFQPGVASSRFDQIADELVGVRSRLTRYLGDLHCTDKQWGVSAYQTIQNLAEIATLPAHPATRVRLRKETAREIGVGGSTMLKGKRCGSEYAAEYLGITLQAEQDFVLIVIPKEKKADIMRTIGERYGLITDAHGLVIAMPIDDIIGLRPEQ